MSGDLEKFCPTDSEVFDAMLSFSLQGCDSAIANWSGGKYTRGMSGPDAHDQIRQNYWRFESMKNRIREVIDELKQQRRT